MNALNELLTTIDASRLAWTLLHTLWQAGVVALMLSIVLSRLPAARSQRRYLCSGTALAMVVLLAAATWAMLGDSHSPHTASISRHQTEGDTTPTATVDASQEQSEGTPGDTSPRHSAPKAFHASSAEPMQWESAVVGLWAIGTFVMLARLMLRLLATRKLINEAAPIPSHVVAAIDELRERLHIARRVAVVLSAKVVSPAVVGVIWPTVVLPVSLATGLNSSEVRIVLAHELAHIRRHDFLVNLLQMIVEAALFFNPAVWWISRQLRNEREACCDSMAATLIGEPITYARVLTSWAERVSGLAPEPTAVAFADTRDGGPVLDRVRRLLVPDYQPHTRVSPVALLGSLLFGLTFVAALLTGTSTIVTLAKDALTDEERAAAVAHAQEEYTPPPIEAGKVKISGTIRTEDGQPIPEGAYVHYRSRGQSTGVGTLAAAVQTFSSTAPAGKIWLAVQANGYSPRWYGPFNGSAGEAIDNIEIVLERGFDLRVHVVNDEGMPLDEATVNARPLVDGSGALTGHDPVTTADDGTAIIQHTSAVEYSVDVERAGYQRQFLKTTLNEQQPVTLTMQPASPATGVVVNPDGEPVPNVELRLFYSGREAGNRSFSRGYSDKDNPVAVSDETGHFSLTELGDDIGYAILLTHPDLGRRIVQDIRAGQDGLRFEIGPDYFIEATIIGEPESINNVSTASINVPLSLELGGMKLGTSLSDRVKVVTAGDTTSFRSGGYWPGELSVTIRPRGGKSVRAPVTIEAGQRVTKVTIDLNRPEPSPPPVREVVFRFQGPDGSIVPRGTIEVSGTLPGDGYRTAHTRPIDEGVARITVVTPDTVLPRPEGLIGWTLGDGGEDSIKVPDGDEPLEITLPVVPAGAIVGQITNSDGSAVADRRVEVSSRWTENGRKSHTSRLETQTDADGRYYLGPIRLGGESRVSAVDTGRVAVAESVTLKSDNVIRTVDLALPPATEVAVQLVDSDGTPVRNLALSVSISVGSHSFGWSTDDVSDRDGLLLIDGLDPGRLADYTLSHRSRQTWQAAVWKGLRLSTSVEAPQRLTLKLGQVLTGQLVERKSGRPVIGAEVYAHQPGFKSREGEPMAFEAEADTDEEGRFRFSNLPGHPVTFKVRGVNDVGTEPVDPTKIESLRLEGTIAAWSKLRTAP